MGLIIVPGREPDPGRGEHAATISPEEIRQWVAEAIAANKAVRRTTRSQRMLDRTVEVLFEEGETYLAASLLCLMTARIAGHADAALGVLMQALLELGMLGGLDRRCRVCGCTQQHACPGGCSWVEIDLCSACAERLRKQARSAYLDSTRPGPGRDG